MDKETKKDLGKLSYFLRNKKVKKNLQKKITSAYRYIDGMLAVPQAYNKAAVDRIKKNFGFMNNPETKKTLFEKNLEKGIEGIC